MLERRGWPFIKSGDMDEGVGAGKGLGKTQSGSFPL